VDHGTQQSASDGNAVLPAPVACGRCGATAESLPLTWTCSVEGGVRRYFCDGCGRANLRSIESRIDSAWW
jgi:hypothetical protein